MTLEISPELPDHTAAIEQLLDLSFGPGRFAKTAYRLREGVDPVPDLSFIAMAGGELRASLRFWPAVIAGKWDALMLGPLAVDPARRGKGIGLDIMRHGLDAARAAGHSRVILVGDAPYYAKVGFSRAPAEGLILPGPVDPDRLLAMALRPGAMKGVSGRIGKTR